MAKLLTLPCVLLCVSGAVPFACLPAPCLQHLVDLFGQFYSLMRHLLPRLLLLLRGFISRSHSSLASVGVAAYARLVSSCGKQLDADGWAEVGACSN